MELDNSSFESEHNQAITPENASSIVSLVYQSAHHNVYKIKINNRWMFLKRIVASQNNNPVYIENLQREFEIGFTLDHPGIVTYFNYGNDREGNYLLTEFIEGEMLREYLVKQKPSLEFIHHFTVQLLDILSYLQQRNIYHLDLKPENILISAKNQQIKLIDFGLAHSDMYTKIPSGTMNYAAPEMFSNPKACNAASDIYSIGVILLELFTRTTDRANLSKIPVRYRKIIARCLTEKQEERFQQYEELKQVFKKTKKRIALFLLIPFVVLLLGVAGFFLTPKTSKPKIDHFVALPNLPEVRNAGRVITYQNKLFYLGGADAAFVRNNTWMYDFNTRKWSEKALMLQPKAEMGCARVKDKIYTFGGWEPEKGAVNTANCYDIISNTWDSIPNLPEAITSVFAVSLGDAIYILGGTLGETTPYFFRYNTTSKTYKQLPVFDKERMYSSLVVYKNEIYAFGGNSFKKGEYQWHNEVDKYNPNTNTWQRLAKIPTPISRSSVVVVANEIHLLGGSNLYGNNQEGIKNVHYVYLPLQNKWIKKSNFPFAICCHQTVNYKGKIIIVGGSREFPNPTKGFYIEKSFPIQKMIRKTVINNRNENSSEYKKSKNELDSLNSSWKKRSINHSILNDSLKICSLGDSVFKIYQIKIIEALSIKSYRPKKVIQLELQRACLEEFEKEYQNYISRFDKHSLRYFESVDIYGKKQKIIREKFEVL